MKAEEFKGKTEDELKKLILDLKKKQFNLRFQKSQGQLENTAQIRTVRRDIARAKLFLSQQTAGATQPGVKKEAPKKAASKAKKSGTKAA